jgi:hypothetical protein
MEASSRGVRRFIERRREVFLDALQKRPEQLACSESFNNRLMLLLGRSRKVDDRYLNPNTGGPSGRYRPHRSKAPAEVAAYADCTESQMMAMFGWTDPKMPAHYFAQANREKLGFSGMDKVVAFDRSGSSGDFAANETGTDTLNGVVTFPGNIRKKAL